MGRVPPRAQTRSGQSGDRSLQSLLCPGEGVRDGIGPARRPLLHARREPDPGTTPPQPPVIAGPCINPVGWASPTVAGLRTRPLLRGPATVGDAHPTKRRTPDARPGARGIYRAGVLL